MQRNSLTKRKLWLHLAIGRLFQVIGENSKAVDAAIARSYAVSFNLQNGSKGSILFCLPARLKKRLQCRHEGAKFQAKIKALKRSLE